MKNIGWQTLDTVETLRKREEQTTSANVGAYPVPLGQPMRNPFPSPVATPEDSLRRMAAADPEYARALRAMGWLDDK